MAPKTSPPTHLSSLEMKPPTDGPQMMFMKSQFLARPQWAPKSTDLSGQTAIVTGGGSGLGFYACEQLLSLKLSHLILAVRSIARGNDAAAELRREYPAAKVELWELEMSSYASIQAFADKVNSDVLPRLDMAILNAALMKTEMGLNTTTGHEDTIQVNFLSTMLLAILLLPALKTKSPPGAPGRLTIVGSGTAHMAKFAGRNVAPLLASFDDMSTPASVGDMAERYAVSKFLGHLFLPRLASYVNPDDVVINIADPGLCKGSSLHRDFKGFIGVAVSLYKTITARSVDVGASTYVDAAVVKGKESHGCFVMDWKVSPFAKMVYDPETGPIIDRLWDETMAEFEFAHAREVLEGMKK
ncbi:putative short-chain dehydrogenase/reductase family protein [Podospora didyma]|uniref:Short-chain dehydrogenase/reductase family protein n=1 Tax=Podospora didyma TaxID=330526 RepID=A0AAE0K9Y7_9PEZI|nr:putative short-chain dehydrogenase/reductase family protein [Podospora didyma]